MAYSQSDIDFMKSYGIKLEGDQPEIPMEEDAPVNSAPGPKVTVATPAPQEADEPRQRPVRNPVVNRAAQAHLKLTNRILKTIAESPHCVPMEALLEVAENDILLHTVLVPFSHAMVILYSEKSHGFYINPALKPTIMQLLHITESGE